ncbi:F-box protein interaction domain protein [Senna tora]|uniref:F-box protein interaction domain protein n=1 Tax=Senna tora TaxID=362788 RepID=A0A834WSU3_9FABA|nr:F-box protein interaction domain protein [Senna tora]
MGPIFDPVLSKQLAPHEPPFHESMSRLPYPNFYYALENFVASYAPSVTYSVHLCSIIVDASTRSEINTLLMLAAYAAVCRHEGLPWRYPGNRIAMKRKSDSIATLRWKGKREAGEVDEPEIQPLWPSFADLPSPITTNILLRLSITSVLICKCVCKIWHTIISDLHFAKLHFKNAPTDVMIRTNDTKHVSRTLHLLQFQPENSRGHSECIYDYICNNICEPNCQGHTKLEAKFKLPLRDAKMVLDKMLEAKNGGRKRSYIACKPRDDKFAVVNSCKSLLCLCDPMHRDPLVVCNPITGEFIRLPETRKILRGTCDSGFGYHEKTREFKVIREYDNYAQDPANAKKWLSNGRVAEMLTLGNGTWKSVGVGIVPFDLRFPTSVNGALHWLRPLSAGTEKLIVRFSFELERFETFPCPLCLVNIHGVSELRNVSMGELGGSLYLCGIFDYDHINLWLMKKYGVRDSWTMVYNMDMMTAQRWPFGFYRPIKSFNNGAAILMYHSLNCLIYHEHGGYGFNLFDVSGTQVKFEAFAHIPSLIPLKVAVKGDVEVHNVHSRCDAFKLREENDVLFLAEDNIPGEFLYSSSSEDWTLDSSDSDEMYVLHEIPVPKQPPKDNQNDDQEHSQGTVQSDLTDVDQAHNEDQEIASQPLNKEHVDGIDHEKNIGSASQSLFEAHMASDKRISLDPVDDDVGLSDALNAPNFLPSNQHIISDTRKDLVANSNLDSREVRHAMNDTSNLLMNLSQIGDAANNTFVEVANYLYENQIGPHQAIKLGQQFMSAQNGELRIMSSNNFQSLPDSIDSVMGFHDSSEISIDGLMSYARKMAHLFYNSYKAWYSKIIEHGYMIEDNEWTRLHATSKLGLALVAPQAPMKILGWNCRGIRSTLTVQRLHQILAEQKPDLVFISKTLSTANIATNMMQRFGFTYSTSIYVIGKSGGMIVAWNERINISVMDVSHHLIHLKGKDIKEVEDAIFNIKAFKSLGPDGFPVAYFHKHWEKVKMDVYEMVISFFNRGFLEKYQDPTKELELKRTSQDSLCWKNIVRNENLVIDNLRWTVGNGEYVRINSKFWPFKERNNDKICSLLT